MVSILDVCSAVVLLVVLKMHMVTAVIDNAAAGLAL